MGNGIVWIGANRQNIMNNAKDLKKRKSSKQTASDGGTSEQPADA